jgi:hypothetical protein
MDIQQAWRAFRTRKIIEFVSEWASKHSIPIWDLAAYSLPRESTPITSESSAPRQSLDLKRAIISAINEMSVSEMEQISIPVRYIIRHFLPR